MKTTFRFALIAALFGASATASMAAEDCLKVAVSVKHAVAAQPTEVLQLVEKHVGANPSCACEVVKAAIEASDADAKTVAAIVETASTVSPEHMRLVAQCAVAVSPGSLAEVQMVMARLDPGKGETSYSGKDAKSPKEPIEVKPAWNPLDFPGQGPVGPNPGGPGGFPFLPPGPPPYVPPVINPPVGTETGFGMRYPYEPYDGYYTMDS